MAKVRLSLSTVPFWQGQCGGMDFLPVSSGAGALEIAGAAVGDGVAGQ